MIRLVCSRDRFSLRNASARARRCYANTAHARLVRSAHEKAVGRHRSPRFALRDAASRDCGLSASVRAAYDPLRDSHDVANGAAMTRRRSRRPGGRGPSLASDFLTEGVDNARTGWVRDEKIFTTANVGEHEAAVEAEAREHAARDAQPVRAARRRARRPRRRARARSPSSPASPTICSGSTWPPASRSGIGASTARWRTRAAPTTRSVPAVRRRCRRWRRRRRASTRCTPCRGTAGCGR